jgi:hypothetical protein
MAVGDALSKNTTYKDVIDLVKIRVNLDGDPFINDTLLMKEIYLSNSRWLKFLFTSNAPGYPSSTTTLTDSITGSANPYSLDISSVSPFIDKIVRVVHTTSAGVRTNAVRRNPISAEDDQQLSNMNSTSLWYVDEGDVLRFYKGSAFTITIASDDVEIQYYRQAKIYTSSASYIDLLDSDIWVIVTDVASTMKQYKGLDNSKEQKILDDFKIEILKGANQ